MPYRIVQRSGKRPWKIIKKATGKVVGSSLTKEDAEASVRARYLKEHGGEEHGKKKL